MAENSTKITLYVVGANSEEIERGLLWDEQEGAIEYANEQGDALMVFPVVATIDWNSVGDTAE